MSVIFWEPKMKIELTNDQIDNIVLFEMQRHAALLKSNIISLKRKRKLKKFEKEDLTRFKEVFNSMNILISYYGSHLTS
jgi:hypothetical protein